MIDYQLLYQSMPYLISGAWITLQISFLSFIFGTVIGIVVGFLQTSGFYITNIALSAYITLIRGTPLLMQLTFMYYLLPMIGITLSNYWVAVTALALHSGAYISQMVKSGITGVSKGQTEAAYVLGFNRLQIARYIVLPQALNIMLPALAGEIITLIKDSSLASALGVMELYKEARAIMNQTYDVVTIFVVIGSFYLLMTSFVALFFYLVKRKLNNHA